MGPSWGPFGPSWAEASVKTILLLTSRLNLRLRLVVPRGPSTILCAIVVPPFCINIAASGRAILSCQCPRSFYEPALFALSSVCVSPCHRGGAPSRRA
eukprot:6393346-Pyramimonas_sp.AAC.1